MASNIYTAKMKTVTDTSTTSSKPKIMTPKKVTTTKTKTSKTSSSAVKTLDYGTVSPGTHFITLKYRKDSSQSINYDTLQFKIIVTPIY